MRARSGRGDPVVGGLTTHNAHRSLDRSDGSDNIGNHIPQIWAIGCLVFLPWSRRSDMQ